MLVEATSSLAYTRLGAERPEALLVLLHGVGGNETQLEALADDLDPRLAVVLPRGPLALGPASFGWFNVVFSAEGPRIHPEQAEDSRLRLADFLAGLQRELGVKPERTVLAGFSQGGIMSASVGLTRPDLVRGFGLLSGRILPEVLPSVAAPEALARLSAFVSHGTLDTKLPVSWAERSDRILTELGVPFASRRYAAGHLLNADMAADVRAWLHPLLFS